MVLEFQFADVELLIVFAQLEPNTLIFNQWNLTSIEPFLDLLCFVSFHLLLLVFSKETVFTKISNQRLKFFRQFSVFPQNIHKEELIAFTLRPIGVPDSNKLLDDLKYRIVVELVLLGKVLVGELK